jgi:hypothetical protein
VKDAFRWLTAVGVVLGALAICVWLGNLWLPWDTETDVLTGGTAGVVVGAVLAMWADSVIDHQGAETAPRASAGLGEYRSQSGVANQQNTNTNASGFQFAPRGRTRLKNVTFAVETPPSASPAPPASSPHDHDGPSQVVPPKA